MKTIRLGRKNCFTLLELLFVIAIIAILAGMLLPALMHCRESANRAKCINNLTQIDILLEMYARDYDGYMPPGAGPDGDIPTNDIYNTEKGYVGLGLILYGSDSKKNPGIFICPTATLADDSEYVDKGFTAAYWNSYDNPFVKAEERGGFDGGYSFGGGPFGEVEDDYLDDDEEYDDDDDPAPVAKKVVKKIYKSSYIYRGYFGVDRKLRKNRGRALVMDYDFMFNSSKIHDTAEVLFMRERLTGSPELSDEEKAKLAAAKAEEAEEEFIGYPGEEYDDIGDDPFGGDPFGGAMGDPFGGGPGSGYEGQLKSNHSGSVNVFIHGTGLRRHVCRSRDWGSSCSDNVMTVKSQTIAEFTRVFQNADNLK